MTRNSDGGVDELQSSGGLWCVFEEQSVEIDRELHTPVLAHKATRSFDLTVTDDEYDKLGPVLERYFRRSAQVPFRDLLIPFRDIPTKYPALLKAIVAWSTRKKAQIT